MVRRRAHIGSTVTAPVGRHPQAGTTHNEVERATLRESDAGQTGWTTDGSGFDSV